MSLEDKIKDCIDNLQLTVKLLTGHTDELNRYAIKFQRTICPLRLVDEEKEKQTSKKER